MLLEADLGQPEPRDPRTPLIRRQTQVEFFEDALPAHWWQNLALDDFPLTDARLLAKSDGTVLARASTWEMRWFGREDGRVRAGLHRCRGRRRAPPQGLRPLPHRRDPPPRSRQLSSTDIEVQTGAENQPALALYASMGFVPIDQSTLYRKG